MILAMCFCICEAVIMLSCACVSRNAMQCNAMQCNVMLASSHSAISLYQLNKNSQLFSLQRVAFS